MTWETVLYAVGPAAPEEGRAASQDDATPAAVEPLPPPGVGLITLNRPEKLNAFTRQLHADLLAALQAAERDPAVRCVVLTGIGKAFCSGQDLTEQIDRPFGEMVRRYYNPLVLRIRQMEKPVLAAINGPAAGAGLSLALACDLRLAADTAHFNTAFAAAGLVPDTGISYYLPRLVGFAKAMELCLLPERLPAAEAARLGLINWVVPAADFPSAWRSWATRLGTGPRSLAYIKRMLNASLQHDLEQQLEYEAWFQELAGRTADVREGIQAFIEKRPPRFQGR